MISLSKFIRIGGMGVLLAVLVSSCILNHGSECLQLTEPCLPDNGPHPKLSEYGFFHKPMKQLEPYGFMLPYDLNTQLFSDYAKKLRMVYIPEGEFITYKEDGVLEFPIGSVLVKNFYYDLNLRGPETDRTLLETRLLIHKKEGWTAETYVWNDEQSDAYLKQTGDNKTVTWIDEKGRSRTVNYLIPAKNDCKTCHFEKNKLVPLGPKVPNLNKTYPYADGLENQLVKWQQRSLLNGVPEIETVPSFPVWDDPGTGSLDQRARAYLDVNCGNCHSRTGSASNSGLFLEFGEDENTSLGICKTPVAAGSGSGGLKYDIVPGHPEQSILIYRMESTKPAVRMPELGRTMVHEESVDLIKEWISSLNMQSCN